MGVGEPTKAGAILTGKPMPRRSRWAALRPPEKPAMLARPPLLSRPPLDAKAVREKSKEAGDKASDLVGVHGAFQDGARAVVKAAGGLEHSGKAVATVAKVAEGDTLAISTAASALVHAFGPTQMGWAVRPVARFGSKALLLLGRGAMLTGVASAAWDTTKAVMERDPAKKDKAWTTAGLTVAGTALGIGGVAAGLAPLGVGLLTGSVAIGLFQLADTYLLEDKGSAWLGEHIVRPIRSLF